MGTLYYAHDTLMHRCYVYDTMVHRYCAYDTMIKRYNEYDTKSGVIKFVLHLCISNKKQIRNSRQQPEKNKYLMKQASNAT